MGGDDPFYRTSAARAVFRMTMVLRLLTASALAAALGPAAAEDQDPQSAAMKSSIGIAISVS